jgi:hypothetical protein
VETIKDIAIPYGLDIDTIGYAIVASHARTQNNAPTAVARTILCKSTKEEKRMIPLYVLKMLKESK